MMEFFKRLIQPPVFKNDPDKTRLARIMNGVLWVFMISMAASGFTIPLSPPPFYFHAVITILSLTILGIFGLLVLRQGHVQGIARFFTFSLWASTTIIVIMMGGIQSPETGAFIICIMFAGLFLGLPWIYTYTILSMFSILGIYSLELANRMPAVELPLNPFSGMVINSFHVILASLFVMIVYHNQKEVSESLRAKQNELAVRNAELNKLMNGASESSRLARAEANNAQSILQAQLDESKTIARISEALRGEQDLVTLSKTVLRELCSSLGAFMGAIFVLEGNRLHMTGSYAYSRRRNVSNSFAMGEGLVGQAALEKITLTITDLPRDYLSASTGMLEFAPRVVMAIPLMNGNNVIGVIELAAMQDFKDNQITLLKKVLENITIAFNTAQVRTQINKLLEQTQQQARELLVREDDLKAVNKEMHAQAESLLASQERLRQQQKELETANSELEERASTLQQQRTILDIQNKDLTEAQQELKNKAEELTLANKYKSEFLANMSHELRTPLNSLLILSRMFANNEGGNLNAEQVEAARIIYNSGTDLLNLINDILDISKVEAGRMLFHFAPMDLDRLANNMRATFDAMAQEKNLAFEVSLLSGLPASIETDEQRVGQIIKNFLSNAFKFTSEGSVKMVIEPAGEWVAFRISDTGIGMTPEQQKRVFEAFQQADGSTSRKYGGTGLGLTISRELAMRLGGFIELRSDLGQGSTFSLLMPQIPPLPEPMITAKSPEALPQEVQASTDPLPVILKSPEPVNQFLPDDRASIGKSDRILLIIDDDENFARLLLDYGRKKDFKCLAAGNGETGLQLARAYRPDAILLDLKLPGMGGWELLDILKFDPELRNIPVHILSASDDTLKAYKHGALGLFTKPLSQEDLESVFRRVMEKTHKFGVEKTHKFGVEKNHKFGVEKTHKFGDEIQSRDIRNLLIVEDDPDLRYSVRHLLSGNNVKIIDAEDGATALQMLRERQFDCVILDLTLPDMSGFDLLNEIQHDGTIHKCPVIVYTGQDLTEEENERLLQYADSVIIKGVKSPERLLDETALFLHRVVAELPPQSKVPTRTADVSSVKQDTILPFPDQNSSFTGKNVLVVDDDVRNAFALSRLLSDKGFKVSLARSGTKALEMLNGQDVIDLVLMDIMMPEMDGYETMQRIRMQPRFKSIPILALTAKAMKGDLEKCIEAGANDYLSKPVDVERLLSLLRVWLYR